MTQIPRLVSLGLLATLIVLLGLTFFHVLAPFLLPLFVAAVLAMLSQPLHTRILGYTKGRSAVAAGLTTAIVLLSLMVPLTLGTVLAARQMYTIGSRVLQGTEWQETYSFLNEKLHLHELQKWLHDVTGDPIDDEELEKELQERIKEVTNSVVTKTMSYAGATPSLLGQLVSAIVSVLTFVVAYYYFLADGPAMLTAVERLVPVHKNYKRHLLQQFDQAVRAVVVATFAAAVAQGVATGIGMQICGSRSFFFITMVATLTALVPLLGTWLIWGPYALWLAFHDGDWVRAGLLAVYGSVFVGLIDNVIRSYVLHSNAKLHPLLAFVSVMGGIQLMGLWGLFVGPVVASCLHALVKIFNTELFHLSREQSTTDGLDSELETMEQEATDLRDLGSPTILIPDTASAPPVSGAP
ncbi:MAG: AI-2E family transporter, partial [Planctomycetota bacterium]|nr:AI-2E family transporter [Planctomycetota bacterium]